MKLMVFFATLAIFATTKCSAFFFGNTRQVRQRPHYHHQPRPVSYHEKPPIVVEDGYGSPAAPVIVDDGYGSPAAPVLGAYGAPVQEDSYGSPSAPVYHSPAPSIAPASSYGSPVSAPVYSAQPVSTGYNSAHAEPDTYGSPVAAPVYHNGNQGHHHVEQDSYGSPAAPVQSVAYGPPTYQQDSYGTPQAPIEHNSNHAQGSYKAPPKEEDSYGAPAAPVLSTSYAPTKPVYTAPATPQYKPVYRPPRLATKYNKPKRQVAHYDSLYSWMMPSFKMPIFNMLMPSFIRRPRFIPSPPSVKHNKPQPSVVKTYGTKGKDQRLEYSGWQPIENAYSPPVPEYYSEEPEPVIITIDNAHEHSKQVSYKAAPSSAYDAPPEPITASPNVYREPQVVYGSAPIEQPLFDYAPVQDLTQLADAAAADIDYIPHTHAPGKYQATHQAEHLAHEVLSGSVYVQQTEVEQNQRPEEELIDEDDEDLYYIFYDDGKSDQQQKSSPAKSSTSHFNLSVNGQTHGFSHNFDHSRAKK